MTTFRSDVIATEDLHLQFVSAEDPDTIGIEVYHEGNMLFDVTLSREGKQSIMFDDAENAEFELGAFRSLVDRCISELQEWKNRISGPDDVWDISTPVEEA